MARDTDGKGATDRLNIDGNLLDTDRWVWAVTAPDGEIQLYQEDPNGSIEPGREVLLHYDNAEDRPLSIGVYDERTTYDESVGREVTFGTYPVTDPATGEEFELWDELPDDGHDSITPLKLVN